MSEKLVEALRAVLRECLDDIKAECDDRYPLRHQYPDEMRRYKRDMDLVERGEAALAAAEAAQPQPKTLPRLTLEERHDMLRRRFYDLLYSTRGGDRDLAMAQLDEHFAGMIADREAAQPQAKNGEWVMVPRWKMKRAAEVIERDGDEHGVGQDLRDMLAAAPQAQVAEPVAWMTRGACAGEPVFSTTPPDEPNVAGWQPLYTHPPAQQDAEGKWRQRAEKAESDVAAHLAAFKELSERYRKVQERIANSCRVDGQRVFDLLCLPVEFDGTLALVKLEDGE